jgi:hypothetical protein
MVTQMCEVRSLCGVSLGDNVVKISGQVRIWWRGWGGRQGHREW